MERNEAAAEKACREIRQLIINYVYKPGDRLYETALAEEMQMSRTPIREALARLLSCGFLEREPNHRGYRVPSLSAQDMQTAFRLRIVLEEHMLRLACRRLSVKDIEYLYSLNEEEKKVFKEENRTLYADLNEKFHSTLAEKSEDAYALRYAKEMLSRTTLYGVFFGGFYTKALTGANVNQRLKPAHVEHRQIIDGISSNNITTALESLRAHLLATYTHYSGRTLDEIPPLIA